jgi:flagellar hook-length control protein FliK
MSSLRISHQNRAGAVPGGETGRTETPGSGVSFAVALGAAGLVQKGASDASFGGTSSESAGGAFAPRKRTDGPGTAGEAAALAAQATLVVPVVGQPISAAAEKAATATAATTSSDSQANAPAGGVGPSPATADGALNGSHSDRTAQDTGLAQDLTPDQLSGSPDLSRVSTPALEANGVPSNFGPAPQNASISSASHNPANLLVSLSAGLPSAAAGQPGAGTGEDGFGADSRGRFTPIASASETGGVAGATSLGTTATPTIPTAPAASPEKASDLAGAGTVSDQIAGQVVRMLSSGSQEAVMRLYPPELGEVTVRVAVSGHDVAAWFGSPEPHVQTAISAAIGQLQADLGNAGYNLNGAWVGADTSGARPQNASQPQPVSRTPAAAPGLPTVGGGRLQPASGVNIYV